MKILRGALLAILLLAAPVALHAQATIPVSGSKVVDNNRQPLTGQLVFTVTDTTDTPITYTPQGGGPTAATFTIPVVKGAVQNIGGFPPTIANPATMSPSNTRYRIQTQSTGGGITYFTFPLTNITLSGFSYDGYVVPFGITVSGAGIPTLNCNPGAMYNNTLASDPYPWVCSKLQNDASVYWTQNPSLNPSCQRGNDQAIASSLNGTTFCIDSSQAFVTPGFVWAGPPAGGNPTQIGLVPVTNLCAGGACGGSATFPTLANVVCNTSTTASRNCGVGDVTNLFATGPTGCVLTKTGTCILPGGAPAGSAQQVQFNGGSAFAASNATLDAPGNFTSLSIEGRVNAFMSQTNPTSNDGILKALQVSGNQVLVGPNYGNTEAPVGSFSVDWRFPLAFFDAAGLFSASPGFATNTMFEDQRFNGGGQSNKGLFIYDPPSYQTGVTLSAIYNRTYYDRLPLLTGQGVGTVMEQNDLSIYGSGKNFGGLADSRSGWGWNLFNTTRGITNPINFNVFCGNGDCHNVQNNQVYSNSCTVGSDECNTLYRNQALEDFRVWVATSPSSQATGATQILGNYQNSSGLAMDGLPLFDSTQASAQFLITVASPPPGPNIAGTLQTSGITWTPDNIGRVLTSYPVDAHLSWTQNATQALGSQIGGFDASGIYYLFTAIQAGVAGSSVPAFPSTSGSTIGDGTVIWRNDGPLPGIPMQYEGRTTTLTITVTGLTSPLTTGTGCWADSNFNESLAISAVGSFLGGTQTATVHARYSHLSFGGAQGSYFSQGPQACKYVEALANRVSAGTAPLRNWVRIIGAANSSTLLYSATSAGVWELWPGGAFASFNFPNPVTLTRDGSGHTSMTISSFLPGLTKSMFRIHAADATYSGDFQVTATIVSGNTVYTWANAGAAGTTTTTAPIYLLANFLNLGVNTEANAAIMIPGCEIVYTGNPATHVMDGSNKCEANNMTVALNDQLEGQHGNEPASSVEHTVVGAWTSAAGLNPTAHFQQITSNLIDNYTWNTVFVALQGGEGQLGNGGGGTRGQSAVFQSISGDRIWGQFFNTVAPANDLWFIGTCPLIGCNIPGIRWNFFDIQNGHSSYQMSWEENDSNFRMSNGGKTFFDMGLTGFDWNGNDGAGNSFVSSSGFSGANFSVGDVSGDLTSYNFAIGTFTTQVRVGSNTSNFTQTPTTFAMDHILSVTGGFTVIGTTTLSTSLTGCLQATAGVVSSTGLACGSGGGGSGVSSVATSGPITGGPITTTGTIGCATCVVSSAALVANAVAIGGGLQAVSTIGADTATAHALFATAGAPAFRAIVAGDIPTLPYLPNSTQLPVTLAASAHNFLTSYTSSTGIFTAAQPAFTDLSGSLGTAQGPSGLTGLLKDTAGTLSVAAATDIESLLQALTGCSTSGNVFTSTGSAFTCQTPSSGSPSVGAHFAVQMAGVTSGSFADTGCTSDGSGNMSCASQTLTGTNQGYDAYGVGTGTITATLPTNYVGWIGPASGTPTYFLQLPSANPTAGQVMAFAAPTAINGVSQALPTWLTPVTAVSVVTANGVSGTSSGGATPALTFTLGAITPTSTNGVPAATMAFLDATSSVQTQLNAKAPTASPTFTGTPVLSTATATSLLATGNVDGTAPVTITTGTTATLGGTFRSGYTLNQEATAATAVAYTLPTAAAGRQYCVGNSWNGTAATTGVLTVNTSASGQFIIFTDGTLSATGGNVTSGGAAADAACFVGVDATHWQQYTQRGTWTKH